MTQTGSVYGQALYELAKDEQLSDEILQQVRVLCQVFSAEPDFLKLLSSPNLSKTERCEILDQSFSHSLHPYLLNFLKILTEKNYVRHFRNCCERYTELYNQDHDILSVTAVTAVEMTDVQVSNLSQKLESITGKHILLRNKVNPTCLGGVQLDYDGKRLDGTVRNRLDHIRDMLRSTVL